MSRGETKRENVKRREITIREACREASSFLCAADSRNGQDADRVSERLMMHLLGWDRTRLYLDWHACFPESYQAKWEEMLERKKAGEPVQYIIGEEEFYGLTFEVGPAVLIPRPETELLVEAALARARKLWPASERSALVAADVGTGSGAIPVTLAVQCADWTVHASDVSLAALAVARRNAARHGVAARIEWLHGDLLAPWIETGSSIDLLLSNPPYIPTADLAGLQTEVREHEPVLALDGGAGDGLDLYRRMLEQLSALSAMPRLVGFEVGMGQAGEVASLLASAADWSAVDIISDLAEIERHVLAWR